MSILNFLDCLQIQRIDMHSFGDALCLVDLIED